MSEVKTNKISSLASNNNITIDPDGTGDTIIASGNVGIGTSSPFSTLSTSVGSNAPSTSGNMASHGATIHNGSGGRAVQIGVNDTGAYNYIQSSYVNNANVGANLAFFTGASERMRIDSSGNLLVGDTAVASGSNSTCTISSGGTISTSRAATNSQTHLLFLNPNGGVGSIRTSGTSTAFNTSSDYRLKENVTADWDATTRLKQLNPVRFNFIADADTTVDGFLAHEVQDIVSEAISGTKDAVDEDGNPEYQGIDQSKLVPLLVKTIQELEARITALEAE